MAFKRLNDWVVSPNEWLNLSLRYSDLKQTFLWNRSARQHHRSFHLSKSKGPCWLNNTKTYYTSRIFLFYAILSRIIVLRYWVRDKTVAILQTTFRHPFLVWKSLHPYSNFIEICFQQSALWYAMVGSDNGLASNRRQAIICTSRDSLAYWGIYASLGIGESIIPFWRT